jgi:hypothetical protein
VDERAEQLKALRREIAESWCETSFRALVLDVLDDMIWEASQEATGAE